MAEFDEFDEFDDDVLLGLDIDNLAEPAVKKKIQEPTPISPALSKSYGSTPEVPVRTRKKSAPFQKIALHKDVKRQESLELPCHFGVQSFVCQTHTSHAYSSLKKFLGHADFRRGQHESISAVLKGRDVCVFWPTVGCILENCS